jgi:hypothetical protein
MIHLAHGWFVTGVKFAHCNAPAHMTTVVLHLRSPLTPTPGNYFNWRTQAGLYDQVPSLRCFVAVSFIAQSQSASAQSPPLSEALHNVVFDWSSARACSDAHQASTHFKGKAAGEERTPDSFMSTEREHSAARRLPT